MPLNQALSEFRQTLETQIREGLLADAMNALLAQLPVDSELHRVVSALITRLNAANKERYRNTIAPEEYQRRVDQVAADCFDLISRLKEADFEASESNTPQGSGGAKKGSVLYRIPDVMQLQKATHCTIRVAVDEDAIIQNIVLDAHVEIRSKVEVSDVMSAELVDPEGDTFKIAALNARTQLIRETGYTEWNFSVTPLLSGVHELLVKVSIMEIVPGFADPIPRDVSLMEKVTILAEPPAMRGLGDTGEFKSGGQSFSFQSPADNEPSQGRRIGAASPSTDSRIDKAMEPPMMPYPEAPHPEPEVPSTSNRGLRALALFLGFLVLVPAATFAIAPDLPAWVNARYIQDSEAAYAAFIQDHPNSDHVESAYYFRAEKSGRLADLRAYEDKYAENGRFRTAVLSRITQLENNSLAEIKKDPDAVKIQRFATDFPESDRLSEVKTAAEARADRRQELLPEVEKAYLKAVQAKPTETRIKNYLQEFPQANHLEEVDQAARSKPEVFRQVQPALEEAYLKKLEQNLTREKTSQFIEKFPEPVKREKLEQIVDKKPALKKQVIKALGEKAPTDADTQVRQQQKRRLLKDG